MTQYRDARHPDPDGDRARIEAYHNSLPHVPDLPHGFNPSGLVPYPCDHGIAVKPARYGHTKNVGVWLDDEGNEKPPYGGRSWGRAKYLTYMEPVNISGKVITYAPKCPVCRGLPRPEDLTTPADE